MGYSSIQEKTKGDRMMELYTLKKAELNQLPAAMELINDGKQYLKEQGSDQWQTGYPDEADILEDIRQGKGYFVTDGTQPLRREGQPRKGDFRGRLPSGGGAVPKPRRQEHAGGHR